MYKKDRNGVDSPRHAIFQPPSPIDYLIDGELEDENNGENSIPNQNHTKKTEPNNIESPLPQKSPSKEEQKSNNQKSLNLPIEKTTTTQQPMKPTAIQPQAIKFGKDNPFDEKNLEYQPFSQDHLEQTNDQGLSYNPFIENKTQLSDSYSQEYSNAYQTNYQRSQSAVPRSSSFEGNIYQNPLSYQVQDDTNLYGYDQYSYYQTYGRSQSVQPTFNNPQNTYYSDPNLFKITNMNQVYGRIYQMSKDQIECRFLQTKIEEGDPRTISSVLSEVFQNLDELMMDPYGNYLCQKLIEYCTSEQRMSIIRKIEPSILQISLNIYGTRTIQKMIESISTNEEIELLLRAIRPHVVKLSNSPNGNHVIQRCLNRFSVQSNQFIFDEVARNCATIATHKHGCCVMQRCIDASPNLQKTELIRVIIDNSISLMQDPFANYVIQYVLGLGEIPDVFVEKIRNNLFELSSQKFSSNVVEKCLTIGDPRLQNAILDELTKDPVKLKQLLYDAYGNYVIQTSLKVANEQQHKALGDLIRPHLPSLRNLPYGKKIQSKLMRFSSDPNSRNLIEPQNTPSPKKSTKPKQNPRKKPQSGKRNHSKK
ncbi:hypothetical protein M0811_04330 [Anaeramoeba ignava]|uniref:PUM-HD domain-containing protein n=1 Tax=Anaeramoeba ignava TaxID=1746090 RepID=A0A9Q0LVI8_ANAIG|nr:hypothetical protein M0811_04330 [Anaeramoeba ignava]